MGEDLAVGKWKLQLSMVVSLTVDMWGFPMDDMWGSPMDGTWVLLVSGSLSALVVHFLVSMGYWDHLSGSAWIWGSIQYRGSGRNNNNNNNNNNQSRSTRGFSNLPDDVINHNTDVNRQFRPDHNNNNPQPPQRFNSRPNNNNNSNPPFNPHAQPYNPYQHQYNNQQFRHPHPHFKPNQHFQRQQQQNVEQSQQFRPPPYQQFATRQPYGQFRPQQRFQRPTKPASDYRNWEQAKPLPQPSCERFTVLSYNILADYLAISHRSELYFHIPRHILDWGFRKRNIMFELGLWSADILCLQEVDRFQDLEEDQKIRGYNGIWKMRTGVAVDGCAIFWRSTRFKLLHEEAIEFNKFGLRENVAQICVLESSSEKSSAGSHSTSCSEGHNKVVICNIHVLYNPKRGEIKLGQVRILLERAYATSKLWDDAPVVLCGEFNSTPKSPLYNFISEQKLNVSELPRNKISGQYSAEIRPKRLSISNFRTQSTNNATQSPTTVDTTHKDEKTAPQIETKEESEGISVNCTKILESISSGMITNDKNSDEHEILEAIEDVPVGEVDSASFLSDLHGPDGSDTADVANLTDGVDVVDDEPFVENQTPFYDPSGWTPMEIEAATGSSECMTVEHKLKLRSTYAEVEDCSGSRDSNGEPQVTSYHRCFQGTVDYIWRSEGLQTVRVLAPIPKHAMEWTPGYPTKKWGSDHIALVAELTFNKPVDE
ncbi:carbon catabolite repressor protein 4 homolog 6-like [Bidens hawaiensis]|uniref:carbon catabolite repressor protein 4 homolog 6-like n=1 Tax=Bidens hawaiensis TaxID=980011 RepID=UPI00404B6642